MTNKVRVVRILIYEGSEEWVRENMRKRSVKECIDLGSAKITESIIGGISGFIEYKDGDEEDA